MKRFHCSVLLFLLLFLSYPIIAQNSTTYIKTAKPLEVRTKLVQTAIEYVGTPYLYGGLSKDGIDCSGLVFVTVRDVTGKAVPRMVKNLYKIVEPVPVECLQPGDLVFFDTAGPLTHVGIFIGTSPDNSCFDAFVHSVSSGSHTGVKITRLSDGYWKKRMSACGRILPVIPLSKVQLPTTKKDSEKIAPSWESYQSAEKERFEKVVTQDKDGVGNKNLKKRAQKKY